MGKGGQSHFRLGNCMGRSKSAWFFIYLLEKTDASTGNGFSLRDNLYFSYYSLINANGSLFYKKSFKPCYIKGVGLDFSTYTLYQDLRAIAFLVLTRMLYLRDIFKSVNNCLNN
jgi:hypothetical protein